MSLRDDRQEGEALLRPAMREGRRLAQPSLPEARRHAQAELARLPTPLRRLDPGATLVVEVSPALRHLAAEVDARLRRMV